MVVAVRRYSEGWPGQEHWPDVYYEPGYGLAEQAAGAGEWDSLCAFDGAFQLPFHVRGPDPELDAISPYGYAGIYVDPALSQADASQAWTAAVGCLRALGLVSLFLRQSPFLAVPVLGRPEMKPRPAHTTYAIDVADPEKAWSSMEGRSRTSIRKAERTGCVASISQATEEDLVHGGSFRRLYEGTMSRRGAGARYMFNDAYYSALRQGLGERLWLAQVTDDHGSPMAAALFMRNGSRSHYHLSGSTEEGSRLGATNLLIWEAIKHSARSGVQVMHLGGGLTSDDSLSRFKRSFGGKPLSYVAAGVVLDEQRYAEAVRRRVAELDADHDEAEAAPVFPAYRWNGVSS